MMHDVSRSSLYLYAARYKCRLQKECEHAVFVEICFVSESRHGLLPYVASVLLYYDSLASYSTIVYRGVQNAPSDAN